MPDRGPLAEAAAAAGVPLKEVERVAADFCARLALETACGTVANARAELKRRARLARELMAGLYLPPPVAVTSGLDQAWPWAAPRGVQYLRTLAELADDGARRLEERAAVCARGGRGRGLAALLAPEPAKVRLARDLADLMPNRPTVTMGGPLFTLVAAVNDHVTGEGERGVDHAVRMALRKPPR